MKHQPNEGAPMWVTRPATQRSLSVINNSLTSHSGHRKRREEAPPNTAATTITSNSSIKEKHQRQWSTGHDSSSHNSVHHSYGRRVSPAFLPSVSSITGITSSNLSTLTYTATSSTSRSPCSSNNLNNNNSNSTNAANSRQPIRTTRIAYEPSVSLSSTHHSSSTASFASSHKSTWAQRINRVLERLFPSNSSNHSDISPSSPSRPASSPLSSSLQQRQIESSPLTSNSGRKSSFFIPSFTSETSKRFSDSGQVARFSRGREASLKDPGKLPSIMESEQQAITDTIAKNSSINQLKSVLKSSKSVFIVAALCILCGSTIFSISFPVARSVQETADSVQLIGLMFVGMGCIIFILALLFTFISYYHKTRHEEQLTKANLS